MTETPGAALAQPTLSQIVVRMLASADRPDRLVPAADLAAQLRANLAQYHAAE